MMAGRQRACPKEVAVRRVRYGVASSLDGYIADAKDGYDWIVADPDIDFAALGAQFDTLLMGRRTYEVAHGGIMPGMEVVVCSRTLRPAEYPGVRIIAEGVTDAVRELKKRAGKDIWLFGGGELFRSLLAADLVDTVEPAVIPVLLGGGVPLLPGPPLLRRLELKRHRLYEKSGIMQLEYDVVR
jgi:dihydrofolate reductase